MRPNNRRKILDVACELVRNHGIQAVTFESVALGSGISRCGVLYHFRNREDLVLAIHSHFAAQWEDEIQQNLPIPADTCSTGVRFAAYARACAYIQPQPGLLSMAEGWSTPGLSAPWDAVLERWAPPVPNDASDTATLERFIGRLASDGMSYLVSLPSVVIAPEIRDALASRISAMMRTPEGKTTLPTGPQPLTDTHCRRCGGTSSIGMRRDSGP